jgi:hypothetical protein
MNPLKKSNGKIFSFFPCLTSGFYGLLFQVVYSAFHSEDFYFLSIADLVVKNKLDFLNF